MWKSKHLQGRNLHECCKFMLLIESLITQRVYLSCYVVSMQNSKEASLITLKLKWKLVQEETGE